MECSIVARSKYFKGENNHQFGLKGHLNSSFQGDKLLKKNNNLTDIREYAPDHPHADKDGRVLSHRLIVERNSQKFDKIFFIVVNGYLVLKREYHVHHINEDHSDNSLTNLMPLTRAEHTALHNKNKLIIRGENGKIKKVISMLRK